MYYKKCIKCGTNKINYYKRVGEKMYQHCTECGFNLTEYAVLKGFATKRANKKAIAQRVARKSKARRQYWGNYALVMGTLSCLLVAFVLTVIK